MAALNLLSRRWVLRIIWELRDGSCGFREIQKKCDRMSPDTLSTRLSELKEAGIVFSNEENALALTPLGKKLGPALLELDSWSQDWAEIIGQEKA
ncbi:winged helix-turn-helix transcriptional regulator [Paremcibacter congregatus]|nr:helix-turn-helix domain-containing protein [Paremcibacter congregatus]